MVAVAANKKISCTVLVLRKAILTLPSLNKLVILRTNGLQYVNAVQVSEFWVVLLFYSGLFDLCCNCELSFWINVFGKLLGFAVRCIVIHSFFQFHGWQNVNQKLGVRFSATKF